jgi:tetratricopeptide (TPR) repeat protein
MPENETSEPVPGNDPTLRSIPNPHDVTGSESPSATAPDEDFDAEPEPEPWTPERVVEWNTYYDKYVMLGALFLIFVVSANRITNSSLWTHIKAGELMLSRHAPVTTNVFSYTEPDARWVDVPWLFQLGHAALYQLVYDFVPANPADPVASQEKAEQITIGVLIGLNALARVLTGYLLLRTRRTGPGLWWSAICAVLALGVIWGPGGVMLGGLARPGTVTPATWGLLMLSAEVYLLHRAINLGARGALYSLIPVFLIWANLDQSFLLGLVILAATVIGHAIDARSARRAPSLIQNKARTRDALEAVVSEPAMNTSIGFIVLAICAIVCLINPSVHRVYTAALTPIVHVFSSSGEIQTPDQLSFLNTLRQFPGNDWRFLAGFYSVIVAIGIGSFVLNLKRLRWSRLLPFLVTVGAGILLLAYVPEFAIVFAAVLALNGQEWYQARFGTEGKLGRLWTVWSTGGRLVTLSLVFLMVGKAITGYKNSELDPVFGFGFRIDDFAFDSAEALNRADLQGNVFNTTMGQGDAMIWKSYPRRKTFIDSRPNFFTPELFERFQKIRKALRDDEVAVWKPELDRDGISLVMIEYPSSPNTYQKLMTSPNWIPFYDDGRTVMFGRADAAEEDLAYFKANRLNAEQMAYHVQRPFVGFQRTPTATTWLDSIFQNRLTAKQQWRTEAARRWLFGEARDAQGFRIPEPSRCFLAIQECRAALSRDPDDWNAYRVLSNAYQFLLLQETALVSGIPLTPENRLKIGSLAPNNRILANRFRQRLAALMFAIQTTPPPRTTNERVELIGLNGELYDLYLGSNFLDMARDRLQVILDLFASDEAVPQDRRLFYSQQFDQLDEKVKEIEDAVKNIEIEQQANPIQQAMYALNQGAPGLAIMQLEEAERTSISPAVVKPQLIDLYCGTGQPDKAFELMGGSPLSDPNLGADPATSAMRQGLVHFLMGNYLSAISLWQERAIPSLRQERSARVLGAARAMFLGEAMSVADTDMSIPGSIDQQANWEFDLAMCRLEAGAGTDAAENFKNALTLSPDMALRPVAAYYLEQLGKPVPPPSANAGATASQPPPVPADAGPASAAPAKPAEADLKEETKKDETKKDETKKP